MYKNIRFFPPRLAMCSVITICSARPWQRGTALSYPGNHEGTLTRHWCIVLLSCDARDYGCDAHLT